CAQCGTSVASSVFTLHSFSHHRALHSFPTRRSSDLHVIITYMLVKQSVDQFLLTQSCVYAGIYVNLTNKRMSIVGLLFDQLGARSEEHTSELQSRENLVCRLLLEKKKSRQNIAAEIG